jgi:hypothetical protein
MSMIHLIFLLFVVLIGIIIIVIVGVSPRRRVVAEARHWGGRVSQNGRGESGCWLHPPWE